MENRKPLNLRNVLIVYNLIQTLFSSWIFYEVSQITKVKCIFQFLLVEYVIEIFLTFVV